MYKLQPYYILRGDMLRNFSYVCSVCACLDLSVSSSSLCLGRAAVCNYGMPWTFLLPFSGVYIKRPVSVPLDMD